jgi:hypothetical protein
LVKEPELDVGFCCQFAIFDRILKSDKIISRTPLKNIVTINFPFFEESFTDIEILEELKIQTAFVFPPDHEPPIHLFPVGTCIITISELWDILR